MSKKRKNSKVLIVDNDTSQSKHLQEHLRLKGHTVWATDDILNVQSLIKDIPDFDFLIIEFDFIQSHLLYFQENLPSSMITIVSVTEEHLGKTIEPINVYAYISKPIKYDTISELLEKGVQQQESNLLHQKEEELNTFKQVEEGIRRQITDPLNHIASILERTEGDLVGEDLDELKKEFSKAKKTLEALKHLDDRDDGNGENISVQTILMEAVEASKITDNVQVDWEFPPQMIEIPDNQNKLLNALTQLLNNSYEAMDGKGSLLIQLTEQDKKVKISIIDQGKGLDYLEKKRVFDPFFSSKHKIGLGLNIALTNIHSLGGKLMVTESIPNQGTTVLIELPLIK